MSIPFSAFATEAGRFSDVAAGDWFAPHVEVCAQEGLLQGGGDGTFRPQGRVNADEALVMAARVLWQANGGQGPLPKGLSPEEFAASLGQEVSHMSDWHGTWAWDGISYFWTLAAQAGAKLPLPANLQESATRWQFFSWLAFAAGGLDLEAMNDISTLPDVEDQAILDLYRAGILTGTDGYGTFSGGRTLIRAEAASLLARLARPALRLPFTPLPAPQRGYTLTRLVDDGASSWGVTPWLYGMDEGFLTRTGELVPFPGNGPSGTLHPSGDYFHIGVYVEETQNPYDTYGNLLGADGRPVLPFGVYDDLFPCGEGFLGMTWREDGRHEYHFLPGDGSPARPLPHPGEDMAPVDGWIGFGEGLLPCQDAVTGLWGYVGPDGHWVARPQWDGADSFLGDYAVVMEAETHLRGLIDQRGQLVLPYAYETIDPYRNSPGYQGGGLLSYVDRAGNAGWVALDGTTYPIDPDTHSDGYRNGYAVCRPADYSVTGGAHYLNLTAQRASEDFDWAGPIGADGVGFVGKNGGIYRIEFHT